jgi:hypothetical protein
MRPLPIPSNIFALPQDVQREAYAFVGQTPPPIPAKVEPNRWRASRMVFAGIALVALAVGAGYQAAIAWHAGESDELVRQMAQIERTKGELEQARQEFDRRQKEFAEKSALPQLPPDPPAVAPTDPVPAMPPQAAPPAPVTEVKPPVATPKVATISIPAAELQAAIRRARAAGPKPAAKPVPDEDQPRPKVTSANWQDLPIEFIPAERSMIASVTAAGVTLKSGGTVQVGGTLSGTGERVLAVDPPGTIITNRRILSIVSN